MYVVKSWVALQSSIEFARPLEAVDLEHFDGSFRTNRNIHIDPLLIRSPVAMHYIRDDVSDISFRLCTANCRLTHLRKSTLSCRSAS